MPSCRQSDRAKSFSVVGKERFQSCDATTFRTAFGFARGEVNLSRRGTTPYEHIQGKEDYCNTALSFSPLFLLKSGKKFPAPMYGLAFRAISPPRSESDAPSRKRGVCLRASLLNRLLYTTHSKAEDAPANRQKEKIHVRLPLCEHFSFCVNSSNKRTIGCCVPEARRGRKTTYPESDTDTSRQRAECGLAMGAFSPGVRQIYAMQDSARLRMSRCRSG
jgi:hypothetical protein